ncbi:outer membrane beta-barrel family protein [Lacinutrix sp. Bg11-31]|uniref:outer membrane beta-barrel family protein n=1 Tax=Lacinutrix sp. Bg11-31 TaxID=2057808 RepID=UPI000C30602D|nr:outer membrane beta-barrel family protein [Lacinutrix sp. Bg11-31]AUC81293.1 TonB-dependent receptor [Lacinutrix sp. Bg11-31]
MHKVIITTILTVFLSFFASAQKEVSVTGKILEQDTNIPLEWATVVISNTDGKIITGGTANEKGEFNFTVNTGTYNVSFEFISFEKTTISNKVINKNFDFGTIYLKEDATTLEEVELIAEKTTVEIKLDKKIYNVGKDLTVRGGTVSDVLDNVPSVSVDVEGNVALRGNDNVRILINGKPSGLVGLNSTDALRQLPAESIEKVEVITSPSARYDAEGTGGIINIILRRSKLQGLNGAITANAGYNPSAGINGNINYRTGNVNIFNTTGYSYREAPGNSSSSTLYKSSGNYLDESNTYDRQRKGLTTNLGVEWYVDDSASLTTSILYRDSNDNDLNTNILKQYDSSRNLLSTTTRLDPETEDDKTVQYALNFQKNYEDSGHKLTFDFQYEDSQENENSLISVNNLAVENVATLEGQSQILLQTDYVLPIGENSQFEAGYRGNFDDTTTDFKVDTLDINTNQFVKHLGLTNVLNFQQHVNAVYTQYGSKFNKFSFLLGLRLENTRITIDQPTTGELNKKNFTGLFPTVNLSYEFNEKENLTLGYARRLRRPRGYFLNPFPSRNSVTNFFQGNPDLDPSYSGQIDLGYLKRFGKFTFNTSTYYSHATNAFSYISFDTGETANVNGEELSIIKRTPINLATENRYGFEFTLTYNPSRKWRVNGNFNFFQNETKGTTPNGLSLDNTNNSWFARVSNKFTLPANIDWQTNLSYRGPSADAQNTRQGVFSTTMAFSKDLFKEKASIAFNVNDLFNSRKRIQETTTPTFDAESEFQWRERSFNLSFTYRFNQKKKREQRGNYGDGEGFEG